MKQFNTIQAIEIVPEVIRQEEDKTTNVTEQNQYSTGSRHNHRTLPVKWTPNGNENCRRSCPECGEMETSFHFIAECPMYAMVRWELQGKDSFSVEDLANLSIGDILRFTKETGRFQGGMLPGHQ
ncbi:jg6277 [Pararge aegeria aegeria]|uniref:Jg6277 protein n=1 Tax=Pararge aegeria aegeria TaxID=348720 RepID=A0A8S4SLU3_9NEOP|nr:jg6277 [Pararge aegeria aegeria]